MKKALILITVLLFAVRANAQNLNEVLNKNHTVDSNKVIMPDMTNKLCGQVITNILSGYHYKKQPLNDSVSAVVFKDYLNDLDNGKLYFLKSDIEKFKKYEFQLDDALKSGNIEPAYEIFNVFKKRLAERIAYINLLLKQNFDFTVNESFKPDREKAEWAETKEELNELWRLRIKNDALNLILSGKEINNAKEVLAKRFHNYHKIVLQYEADDVFSLFINSFTQVYDPHTDYLLPPASENFNIAMRLSLEGIGATLRQDGDYTTVVTIVPGGPAYKSKLIHEEDRIIAVAQGDEGEMVDVIGWKVDDAIQLIRGKKGTVVRLQILRAKDGQNASPVEIKLVREEIKLEEQAAKDEIIDVQENGNNFRFGVVKLPSFYTDFEGQQKGKQDYRSTTRDVKNILLKFKKQKVDGVIMDIRNNGGGSLQEAIQLTGLFIKEGPVVQVKNASSKIEVDQDTDPTIVWDGPLTVMVNRFSASASEIFAAAIQDYGRGVIVGSNSYGKGTVQNMIDLSNAFNIGNKKLGKLKLTIAKFYRINGGTTQHLGVKPDINFPSQYTAKEFGESGQPSALPYDKIPATPFKKYSDLSKSISLLQKEHDDRARIDPEYLYIVQDVEEIAKNREKKEISLNETVRRKEKEEAEAKRKMREEERAKSMGLKIEEKKEVNPPVTKENDYELKESGKILADLILSKVG